MENSCDNLSASTSKGGRWLIEYASSVPLIPGGIHAVEWAWHVYGRVPSEICNWYLLLTRLTSRHHGVRSTAVLVVECERR